MYCRIAARRQGLGMVWKVMSITRSMERVGGVYLDLEAIGLNRDIRLRCRG
jgi:hypothetical protein